MYMYMYVYVCVYIYIYLCINIYIYIYPDAAPPECPRPERSRVLRSWCDQKDPYVLLVLIIIIKVSHYCYEHYYYLY